MSASPFFSIIIPTYNRPERLRECLNSLTRLSYPVDDFEVIVVDDGSPQRLENIVELFKAQLPVQLLRQQNAGPASARNNGAQAARGAYLAFTDDDCRPAPDWLTQMAAQLEQTPEKLLGGKTVNQLKDNVFSATSQFIVDIVYEHFNGDPEDATFFASNNMVVPARVFRELGGFPVTFSRAGGEDREFCDRWLWKGYKMRFVEQAVMYHFHHLSLLKFCKQHFSYGIGAYHFHHIRRQRKSGTMAREMKFHTNLKNWLLAPFFRKEKYPFQLFFLLILWQVANLGGFLWAAWFEKRAR